MANPNPLLFLQIHNKVPRFVSSCAAGNGPNRPLSPFAPDVPPLCLRNGRLCRVSLDLSIPFLRPHLLNATPMFKDFFPSAPCSWLCTLLGILYLPIL